MSLWFLPVAFSIFQLVGAVGTHIIGQYSHRTGQPYSYLCKSGSQPPARYLFVWTFMVSAGLLTFMTIAIGESLYSMNLSAAQNSSVTLSNVFGILSAVGLSAMTVVSVDDDELLHNSLSYVYVGAGVPYMWMVASITLSLEGWTALIISRVVLSSLVTVLCVSMVMCISGHDILSPRSATVDRFYEGLDSERDDLLEDHNQFHSFTPEYSLESKAWVILQLAIMVLSCMFFATFYKEFSKTKLVYSG